jgi:hypothetical protein
MVYNMHACDVMHQKNRERKEVDRVRQVREHGGKSTEGGKCEWN